MSIRIFNYSFYLDSKDYTLIEYQDSLHEHFIYPYNIKDGNYMPPLD